MVKSGDTLMGYEVLVAVIRPTWEQGDYCGVILAHHQRMGNYITAYVSVECLEDGMWCDGIYSKSLATANANLTKLSAF